MALISQFRPVTLWADAKPDASVLRELAGFWKIPCRQTTLDDPRPTIFTTKIPRAEEALDRATVVISPHGVETVARIGAEYDLDVSSTEALITLPVASNLTVSVATNVYRYSGPRVEHLLFSGEHPVVSRVRGARTYLLSLDLVGEYSRLLYGGLDDIPSWKFRLASKLPFSYQSIPQFIRDRSFRSQEGIDEIREDKLGPIECLRTLFLASLIISSGPIPIVGFWRRGKTYALAVTHDVETRDGLDKGSSTLLRQEQKLGIRSTWNLPSDRYSLSAEALDVLKDSEIGAHDTKHDGRLAFLQTSAKIQRLSDCREKLGQLTGRRVRGFRAPLLQHSSHLVSAAAASGYDYDSSCPSWEILSPTSMMPHGVGTVFPFDMNGILEIPVSLPQDHQLIRVGGQEPRAAVDFLLRLSKWIRGLGGPCILLIHPDYEFSKAEYESEYHRLLEGFVSDPTCDIMTLGELTDWWRYRSLAHWDVQEDRARVVCPNLGGRPMDLQTELVTGYGPDGFTKEALS